MLLALANWLFAIGYELFPNGSTAKAGKSYFGGQLCQTIVAGDMNGDCEVNFEDFMFIALHWLTDNSP